ncbi:hypothetical protein L9F63_027392, partial [Diploptera punctata]
VALLRHFLLYVRRLGGIFVLINSLATIMAYYDELVEDFRAVGRGLEASVTHP